MTVPDSVLLMTVLRAVGWYNKLATTPEARVHIVEGSRIHIRIEGNCGDCQLDTLIAGLLDAFSALGLDAVVEEILEDVGGYVIIVWVTPQPPVSAS